ncbi:MAG: CTP synthase [Chloroflexi bacterium]|nr:CTP synthase [Chloroflexota bacterium]
MTKYIFVTGGVASSVGKGVSVASIGRLLKSRGLNVAVQKLDPYLNVDPGTMSPYQHGEVFVTKDGCEADLDLGHYERFIDIEVTRSANVTAGQIYSHVIGRERHGDYLGGTIQIVPHVTNAVKEHITRLAQETQADVVAVEVGGTVGDIEGLPFLEAIRQMRKDVGRDNCFYIHVTLLPYLTSTGELKTKPTQHSVKELRSIGVQPDAILCRSDYPVAEDIKNKIALFCDVDPRAVIPLLTVSTVYEVPLVLEDSGLGELLTQSLGLPSHPPDLAEWREMVASIKKPREPLPIAVVGKYTELPDAYISVKEALKHAALAHDREVEVTWVSSERVEQDGPDPYLRHVSGIVVPGGFGSRGIEGMVMAAQYARERQVPYLGLCLGMQVMVVEFARHCAGMSNAHSTEVDPETPYPVIDLLPEQRRVVDKGGTMRLGNYPCCLVEGSVARQAYGTERIVERHRHRYELNNQYRDQLERQGLRFSGLSPDGRLVEIAEVEGHTFMAGSQFHPEFRSRPNRAHPLFRDFISAAKEVVREGGQRRLPLDGDAPSADGPTEGPSVDVTP